MKVKRIDLDDQEMPELIQVELTHDEATYLAVMRAGRTATTVSGSCRAGASWGAASTAGSRMACSTGSTTTVSTVLPRRPATARPERLGEDTSAVRRDRA